MQLTRPRRPEQSVPRLGPKSHHARKPGFNVAKFHSANQRRKITAKGTQRDPILRTRLHRQHQKDRGARQRSRNRLRQSAHALRCSTFAFGIQFHRLLSCENALNSASQNRARFTRKCLGASLSSAAD
jgi:hypothetical protein